MAHLRLADSLSRMCRYELGSRVRISDFLKLIAEAPYLTAKRAKKILPYIVQPEMMQGQFFVDIRLLS